jgi:hypothetical protein
LTRALIARNAMRRRYFVSHVLRWGFAGAAVCCVTGCGTLLHSERHGQPHSNQIDWKIAALDGLGLILFFVPGVIAFAVDFSTGAIYLPTESSYPGYGANPQQPPTGSQPNLPPQYPTPAGPTAAASAAPRHLQVTWQELGLTRVVIPREELQQQRIEQVATNHTGQRISLDDSQSRLSVLPSIERFDAQASRHRSDRTFGLAVQSFFERLKQA